MAEKNDIITIVIITIITINSGSSSSRSSSKMPSEQTNLSVRHKGKQAISISFCFSYTLLSGLPLEGANHI